MLTIAEFDRLLADPSKRIRGDLRWDDDHDHAPAVEFRAEVESDEGWPLFVAGRFNPAAGTLSFALVYRGAGPIYALNLGADHHNPTCERVGEKHKHRWTEGLREKVAYVPEDITAPWTDPLPVWQQFCGEVGIRLDGALAPPPPQQGALFW